MAAKSKQVDVLSVADIGVPEDQVGSVGAGQEITEVSKVEDRGGGEIVVDEGDGAERILAFLKELKVL
jgi:electron transfer flavoprotein beta subunit